MKTHNSRHDRSEPESNRPEREASYGRKLWLLFLAWVVERWVRSRDLPAELTVTRLLIVIVGVVLVVLILAAAGAAEYIAVTLKNFPVWR